MPYLIDGHNLIGKLGDIQLHALDDERALIELLKTFCRQNSKNVEVFFDNAPPNETRTQPF